MQGEGRAPTFEARSVMRPEPGEIALCRACRGVMSADLVVIGAPYHILCNDSDPDYRHAVAYCLWGLLSGRYTPYEAGVVYPPIER
jgi:hypothetical protein